jgi:acyl-coenzyme A synthetase/AMP-(fatty) acid ligase/pimeloyl-ACP methyl ester carboxylesterase
MVKNVRQLPGIDPTWVRSYTIHRDGNSETIAVLESSPTAAIRGTVVCVHGNPTWSYLWRQIVQELGLDYRVIAIDQLGMGFSSRPTGARTLAQRIDDLDALIDAADVHGPVTLIAHDWGGPVALGWATKNKERVEKLVLFNTGTHIPTTGVPGLIRVSNTPFLRNAICSVSKAFLVGAVAPTGGIPRDIRSAYYAPYASAARRRAIADFVADIPTTPSHVSTAELQRVAEQAHEIKVPTLLMWGTRDFVFHTGVLADMQKTFPHAHTITLDIGHLSPEHPDAARLVHEWLDSAAGALSVGGPAEGFADLNAAMHRRASTTPNSVAVFDAKEKLTTSWADLLAMVQSSRGHLRRAGVKSGDRVAILTPFSAQTIACIYACWSEGIVPVVADPGLGISNMRRALRESRPLFVLTMRATRIASRVLHLAHRAQRLDLEAMTSISGQRVTESPAVVDSQEAAVLYTSGATGPAKGVVYTHGQLRALAHAIQQQFSITDDDGIAAAYIPFALYGPAWGVAVALPKINVVAPGKLAAKDLHDALNGVNGTILFAAPAPLRNVIKDAAVFPTVRCMMSAGAPVSDALLHDVAHAFPHAELFSPYGMTEMLIVTDGVRAEASHHEGVSVGRPLPGVNVMVLPLGFTSDDVVHPVVDGVTGEVFVTGPWLSVGYDQHWQRNRDARVQFNSREWHRTGDVGHVKNGLFIEGRSAHVLRIGNTVLTPVPIEQAVENLLPDVTVAAVTVPVGSSSALVVVLCDGETTGAAVRPIEMKVREVAPDVVAVLFKKKLPVDRRHNSKIDRIALGQWANEQLT